jgi:hypothetical protein
MVQRNLFALHSFLEGNPHLFHSATGDFSGARAAPTSDQEAWKVDHIPPLVGALIADQRPSGRTKVGGRAASVTSANNRRGFLLSSAH